MNEPPNVQDGGPFPRPQATPTPPPTITMQTKSGTKRPRTVLGMRPAEAALLLGGFGLSAFLANRHGGSGTGEPLEPPKVRGLPPIGTKLPTPEVFISPITSELLREGEERAQLHRAAAGMGLRVADLFYPRPRRP